MSTIVEVIRTYGGTVDKFTGVGLMALFGAPITHENDPERALRAALDLQPSLEPLRQQIRATHGFDLQIRIGINTGWVVAGKIGNGHHTEYTVMGDAVDLASSLEKTAEPGTVLVSVETYHRTRPHFEFQAISSPGLEPGPAQTYRLLTFLAEDQTTPSLPDLDVPMVGRSHEIARLQEALAVVRDTHQRRIVLITGEAGVGKSRIVAEFRHMLDSSDIKVYQGACSALTQASPLFMVTAILRDLLKLSHAASNEDQQQVLRSYLQRHNLGSDDTYPYLLHALGLKQSDPRLKARLDLLDAAMLQRQTHSALRKVFLTEASLTPVALIFEDLHWLDAASRNFLEFLFQTTEDAPLLILLIARPDADKTVLNQLTAAADQQPQQLEKLKLQALSTTEGRLLIDQLIVQTSHNASMLKRQITGRAEGNPFYMEEIVRMLIDHGGLQRRPESSVWEVMPAAEKLLNQIPGTVKGLVLARLDRLPESVRQTLQRAAVIGTSFPASLLSALTEMSPRTMEAHLDELVARQFLRPQSFRSEPGYSFRHALLQETVYSTLLKRTRRPIHSRVAQAVEQSSAWQPDEKTEALAYHFLESTEPARALPHVIRAAENAARRCAHETAIDYYRQAIRLLPREPGENPAEYFRVRTGLGRSLKYIGELHDSSQVLSESLHALWRSRLAEKPGPLCSILTENLQLLSDIRQREGAYGEAMAYLEAGLQVLGEAGPRKQPRLWRSLLDRMAWIRFRQGQLDEASSLALKATVDTKPEQANDPVIFASLYNTLGTIAWQQGALDKAVTYVRQSLRLHEDAGYSWGKAVAYTNLALFYDGLGDWPTALEYSDQAFSLQEMVGDRHHQIINLNNSGQLRLRMGEHEVALKALETGLGQARALGDVWGTALCHVGLAELYLIQSRLEEAKSHAEAGRDIADDIGSYDIQSQARRFLALILAYDGTDLQASLELAEQALTLAQEAKLFAEEANCYRTLGIIYGRIGRPEEAQDHLQASIHLTQAQKDPYRHGLALMDLGYLYLEMIRAEPEPQDERQTKARLAFSEAAENFRRLGADYDLDLAQIALDSL